MYTKIMNLKLRTIYKNKHFKYIFLIYAIYMVWDNTEINCHNNINNSSVKNTPYRWNIGIPFKNSDTSNIPNYLPVNISANGMPQRNVFCAQMSPMVVVTHVGEQCSVGG